MIGAFWHLLNFAAAPACVGLLATLMAKLVWRREMAGRSLLRLWIWSAGLAWVAAIAALIVLGHDGKIANYSTMVLASAAGLWWAGFGRTR